jgi:hypothetical protein
MSTSLIATGASFLALAFGLTAGAALAAPGAANHAQTAGTTHSTHAAAHGSKCKPQSHHRAVGHRTGRSAWLVPPPPAYMPTLSQLYGRQARNTAPDPASEVADEDGEPKKPENPYKKYIHTPDGEAPQPIQNRKGVTTWSQRS